MLPTAGFIPPPVVPLVPSAANGIVATGGLLGGMAAGALAGGRAGAIFGPKGVVAGAVIGGLLVPLLFPAPAQAPGTGLDPGINPKESPEPAVQLPEGEFVFDPDPNDPEGTTYSWQFWWYRVAERFEERSCSTGEITYDYGKTEEIGYTSATGVSFSYTATPARYRPVCSGEGTTSWTEKLVLKTTTYRGPNNTDPYTINHTSARDGTWVSSSHNTGDSNTVWIKPITVRRDEVNQPMPAPPKPEPIPLPNPIEPLPLPQAPPAPAEPEPLPEPEPLEVPSPNTPTAPPITIPKAPPAPPEEVPDEKPGPSPLPYPIEPGVVPIPSPVPGVPTIPEPTPDPEIQPAPQPAPNPVPGPGPVPLPGPETDPQTPTEPGVVPTPSIPGIPGPGPITTPATPENPTAVDPGTGIVPQPTPLPTPTSPGSHFPVPGGPAVTPGGTRPDLSGIAAEVGRIEQKVARLQNGKDGLDLSDWLWLLPLLQAFFEQPIPGTTYDLQGVCEPVEPGGDQPVAEFPVAEGLNLQAIINRLDVMQDIFQQHLAYRTPTCRGPKNEGDFRTLSFISDEQSPNGKSRVAKRYLQSRSSADIDGSLAAVIVPASECPAR